MFLSASQFYPKNSNTFDVEMPDSPTPVQHIYNKRAPRKRSVRDRSPTPAPQAFNGYASILMSRNSRLASCPRYSYPTSTATSKKNVMVLKPKIIANDDSHAPSESSGTKASTAVKRTRFDERATSNGSSDKVRVLSDYIAEGTKYSQEISSPVLYQPSDPTQFHPSTTAYTPIDDYNIDMNVMGSSSHNLRSHSNEAYKNYDSDASYRSGRSYHRPTRSNSRSSTGSASASRRFAYNEKLNTSTQQITDELFGI